MLAARAAHLECGIPVEKLSIAAQFFHVAWHEVECDEDTPDVSSYHTWFDDFAFKEKQDIAEYNRMLEQPAHFSMDDGNCRSGNAHVILV